MHWSRRNILAAGLAAPVATAFAPCAEAALHGTSGIVSSAQFAALRGETFLLHSDDHSDQDFHAILSRVDANAASGAADDGCFVLHFDIAGRAGATQAVYTVRHPALQTFAVLAVPASADGRSLAVVFNSPR